MMERIFWTWDKNPLNPFNGNKIVKAIKEAIADNSFLCLQVDWDRNKISQKRDKRFFLLWQNVAIFAFALPLVARDMWAVITAIS